MKEGSSSRVRNMIFDVDGTLLDSKRDIAAAQTQGTDDTPFKPDPFIINKILIDQGWQKEETVMVGDTDSDIKAGKNAGVRTCGVSFGSLTRAQLEALQPDSIIDRFDELLTLTDA